MVEVVQPEAREWSSWDFLLMLGGAMRVRGSLPGESLEGISLGERVSVEEDVDLEVCF